MDRKPYRVTEEGLERLKTKIQNLEERISETARRKGEAAGIEVNWHDNFAFEQLVREEEMLSRQISELRDLLKRAILIEDVPKESAVIGIGSLVKIEFENGEREIYVLTDPEMADPSGGSISYASPLGQAISGARIGDIKEYSVRGKQFLVKIIGVGNKK